MAVAIVTGAAGLIGSESVRTLDSLGFDVVGIDNDMRSYFFGPEASTHPVAETLLRKHPRFKMEAVDIRDQTAINRIFSFYGKQIVLVIHAAAQPSHDWAAREPLTDFGINATGTLHLLEATRHHCSEAVFIFTSTNKVYGDTPNRLPLIERGTRWELDPGHRYFEHGVDESMSIDQNEHSLYGASKVAADVMVQEYGRYFGLKTGIFRGGCLTGPQQAGAELHGFLAYLMKCALTGREYKIFGYRGKQVRDNIHCADLVKAFVHFFRAPRSAEVYNIGGGRHSNCSLLEAVSIAEKITGRPMNTTYLEANRTGDHLWWISDTRKFQSHYPAWSLTLGIADILQQIADRYTPPS
ncbi:MAG: NAD-dependent epimerase/dehydratase family protein [Kiritimatiellae bacterium]|nr:NAD-dependent epimerase/dehydratase family protein [Kiritimatiellia bacterium]MCO6401206.1 NAD-dependent epimerase/dehydratase family protein [Verrucomicrobiota bacterium]